MEIDTRIINSAKYIITIPDSKSTTIEANIDGKKYFVPIDLENSDYAEIMKRVDAGELTIEPADEGE